MQLAGSRTVSLRTQRHGCLRPHQLIACKQRFHARNIQAPYYGAATNTGTDFEMLDRNYKTAGEELAAVYKEASEQISKVRADSLLELEQGATGLEKQRAEIQRIEEKRETESQRVLEKQRAENQRVLEKARSETKRGEVTLYCMFALAIVVLLLAADPDSLLIRLGRALLELLRA